MKLCLKNSLAAVALFLSLQFAELCQAQERLSAVRLKPEEELQSSTGVHGSLQFEGAQYPSSIPGSPELNQSLLATVHLLAEKNRGTLDFKADFKAQKYVDWGGSHFSIPELYMDDSKADDRTQITLGRKKYFWSQMDEEWNMGLWQPKDYFDGLRPELQGLTGFFAQHQNGKFEVLAFASPLFVPSMGPDIEEENGQLTANNRWFRSPSETFLLRGKERQAFYSIAMPPLEELINRPGGGLRFCYGCNEIGTFVSASVGHKPMNSLLIKYSRTLNGTDDYDDVDTGSAEVVPVVGYHTLSGADLGYRFEKALVSVSYLEDHPVSERPAQEDIFIYQNAKPMKSYSALARMELGLGGFQEPVGLSFGYLRVHGGDYDYLDADGKSSKVPFSQRFNYTNAASIQADFRSSVFNRKWISRIKYLREFDQVGMVGSFDTSFYPWETVMFTVGADVLGVDDSSAGNKDDGFLNSFRANDRIYGGVSYVF